MSPFPPGSNAAHHALYNRYTFLKLFNLWHNVFLVIPWFSWPCQFLRFLARHILKCSSTWIFLIFSHGKIRIINFCKESHRDEVQFSSHDIRWHMLSTWLITSDNFGHLDTVVFARFFHCKVAIFLFHTLVIRSEPTKSRPQSSRRELCFISWREEYPYIYKLC